MDESSHQLHHSGSVLHRNHSDNSIDHVLGRPSVRFRKIQVLAVVSFWSLYLLRGHRHGPPVLRAISRRLTPRLTAWQSLVVTLLWLYVARNFGKLLGLECPEPLANLYSRSFFRATWFTTALDAGFWTAMRIRRKWLRDLASVVFSVYYLFAAEQADEKVRKVRGTLTVDHMRVSWDKGTTPYLNLLSRLLRPKFTRYPPRAIRIPRPRQSAYTEPVSAWLYFDGPISALKNHRNVVLDVPGGGFVAMGPRTSDDKLLAWAGKTGLPVLSLDYKKAPEYPYPYALNECYDVYHALIASRGRCIGLSGEHVPRVVLTGDSAGGNLATGVVLMILQSAITDARRWQGEAALPTPAGLILIYPALDMNIGNWMTEEQMALIKDRRSRKTNRNILRRKSEDYSNLTPGTPHPSDDENDAPASPPGRRPLGTQPDPSAAHIATSPVLEKNRKEMEYERSLTVAQQTDAVASGKPQQLKTRLAMSSMISYFNDRILTPEMMRAMIILYVGPHNRPDFSTDFLLSPLLAPEALLAEFPPTYFQTGERDPLVDDTVIFAGRIRRAKHTKWMERKELGLLSPSSSPFDERDHVEVALVPGISHGFLQFAGVFPEGWKCIFRCARWIHEIFEKAEVREHGARSSTPNLINTNHNNNTNNNNNGHAPDGRKRHHRRVRTESSGDEDRPLEMMMTSSTQAAKTSPSLNPALSATALASAALETHAAGPARHTNSPSSSKHNRGHQHNRSGSSHHHHHHHRRAHDNDEDEDDDDDDGGGNSSGSSEHDDDDDGPDETGARTPAKLKRSNRKDRRNASTVSLASEDDLLGRRMKGVAGGLMGMTAVTPTPAPASTAATKNGNGRRATQTAGSTVGGGGGGGGGSGGGGSGGGGSGGGGRVAATATATATNDAGSASKSGTGRITAPAPADDDDDDDDRVQGSSTVSVPTKSSASSPTTMTTTTKSKARSNTVSR